MYKYHFDIKINDRGNNAGTKATEDCRKILLEKGYRNIELSFIKSLLLLPLNFVKLFSLLGYYLFIIPRNSIIIAQYPLKGINQFFGLFISVLKKKDCKFFCIIHDLDSLRATHDQQKIKKEISALSAYHAVISHNSSMSSWLRQNGFTKHVEEIYLFDYLLSEQGEKKDLKISSENLTLAFAGNLNKATFLKDLSQKTILYNINLYGPLDSQLTPNKNVKWLGSFPPEQIPQLLEADFGLVWDGDSTDDITGELGSYLRYNTPHKISLYLVAGLPVIISENAAMAGFIKEKNIGFTIKSLNSLLSEQKKISEEAYGNMKKNVGLLSEHLKKGWYLSNAVDRVENFLYHEKAH